MQARLDTRVGVQQPGYFKKQPRTEMPRYEKDMEIINFLRVRSSRFPVKAGEANQELCHYHVTILAQF